MKLSRISVSTYSGYRGEERPVNFNLNGKKYIIKDILYNACEEFIAGGRKKRYRVKTDEGLRFDIYYDINLDLWFLEG